VIASGHISAIVVTSSTPLWYATRATGLVALVLLTGSMAMGLLSSVRFQRPDWPRFVTLGLHRNLSLLALAFTVVHVLTTVLDSFVAIPLQDAFIPFISSYRPIWLGLGAIALTALCVLAITGLTLWRLALAWPARPVASTAGLVVVVLVLIASGAWLRAGPLAPGWSARSGTHSSSQARAEPPPHRERR